jgi:Gas vesicle synthesis protein GvpL/GvpF
VAEATGVWVYAIAETVGTARLGELSGVGGGRPRLVEAAGLMAIVEDVGLDECGESALRRNLEDLAWLEAAARAHHRVIDGVGQLAPVMPMRLATVYSDDTGVSTVLAERGADFRQALRRIGTRREWGVKAYAAQPSESGGAPGGAAAGPPAAGAGTGAAYLQRRRSELSAHKDARRAALRSAQEVHCELSRLAVENRLHAPQAPQLTGTREQMILNAAYLLDDERGDDFAAVVSALAEQHPGVRLELTGPWPPYSFAAPEVGEERAEAAEILGGRSAWAHSGPRTRCGRRWRYLSTGRPGHRRGHLGVGRSESQRSLRNGSPWWTCWTGFWPAVSSWPERSPFPSPTSTWSRSRCGRSSLR